MGEDDLLTISVRCKWVELALTSPSDRSPGGFVWRFHGVNEDLAFRDCLAPAMESITNHHSTSLAVTLRVDGITAIQTHSQFVDILWRFPQIAGLELIGGSIDWIEDLEELVLGLSEVGAGDRDGNWLLPNLSGLAFIGRAPPPSAVLQMAQQRSMAHADGGIGAPQALIRKLMGWVLDPVEPALLNEMRVIVGNGATWGTLR